MPKRGKLILKKKHGVGGLRLQDIDTCCEAQSLRQRGVRSDTWSVEQDKEFGSTHTCSMYDEGDTFIIRAMGKDDLFSK